MNLLTSVQSEQSLRCPREETLHLVGIHNPPSEDSDQTVRMR